MAMAGESASRPLLPQNGQAFTFAPQNPNLRDAQQRNYVFVDEHNRHKRLKVMRACEGCRRRKIKCDSATTNTWPCGSCTRLKLACVPPTLGYEQDGTPDMFQYGLETTEDYPTIPIGNISDYTRQHMIGSAVNYNMAPNGPPIQHSMGYPEQNAMYHQAYAHAGSSPGSMPYNSMPSTVHQMPSIPSSAHILQPAQSHSSVASHADAYLADAALRATPTKDSTWLSPAITSPGLRSTTLADDLSVAMGDLKIDRLGASRYIADKFREHAFEDVEVKLPVDILGQGVRVRIPPEMKPKDETALRYIDYFFEHIHPYVPVINKAQFMHRWRLHRESISPLILEAIFACSTMAMGDVENGQKWLALSARHEESFKDVPRLSTVQALLILLKARESAPRKGYFYRSWTTLVNIIAMAKEIDLDKHSAQHDSGGSCNDDVYDCTCKTRSWQLCYALEAMIGGPQGRFDMNILEDTVNFDAPAPMQGIDDREFKISRQWFYYTLMVQNIRKTIGIYVKLHKVDKEWFANPEYTQHDVDFQHWVDNLPEDMQIAFPLGESLPQIPDTFVANMHCYYYLGKILHTRPKIQYMEEKGDLEGMRRQLLVCHDAAKKMCRIQESFLNAHGLSAFHYMQRGISFTVYCVLSCTMLHLVSLTSPDPALNVEARGYFIKHMQILEKVAPMWPMPEAKAQIDSLREAFSADTTRPFELKPNFPYSSPALQNTPSPLSGSLYRTVTGTQIPQSHHLPPVASLDMVASATATTDQRHMVDMSSDVLSAQSQQQWNPSKIFEQWNVAFGTPQSSTQSVPSPPSSNDLLGPDPAVYTGQHATPNSHRMNGGYTPNTGYSPNVAYMSHQGLASGMPSTVSAMGMTPTAASPSVTQAMASNYVTPNMWQDAVASSFGGGMKRSWNHGQLGMNGDLGMSKRRG